jgi:hypothetical protein
VLLGPKGYLSLVVATCQLEATLSRPGVSDTANLLAPPWNAWNAAKAKLRQALGEGELIAILQSRSTGSRIPIKTERWRTDDGYAALWSGGRMDEGGVFLREDDFARWLAGELPAIAAESSVPPPAEYVPAPVRVREQTDPAPPLAGKKSPRRPRRHRTKQQKLEDAFDALQAGGENIQSPASVKALLGLAMKEAGFKDGDVDVRTIERARSAILQRHADC